MEFAENAAYWVEQKAENVATATNMDESLKRLDSAALNGVVKVEDTHNNVSIDLCFQTYSVLENFSKMP